MHRLHNAPSKQPGPQTAGATLHETGHYDLFSSLFGLGVNRPNSRKLIQVANVKPGDRVLDVGCGTGNLTLTAHSYAGPSGQVYGIDAAPEMIEAAKKKAAQLRLPVVFEIGLIEQLAFPDATFDVVISRLAIHHLPNDLKHRGFAEILRVLKPGGRLLIADFVPPTNPILNHLLSAIGHSPMMQNDIQKLLPMLTDAGFVDVRQESTHSTFMAFISGNRPIA